MTDPTPAEPPSQVTDWPTFMRLLLDTPDQTVRDHVMAAYAASGMTTDPTPTDEAALNDQHTIDQLVAVTGPFMNQAVQKRQADAWDEGWTAGSRGEQPHNPYRDQP